MPGKSRPRGRDVEQKQRPLETVAAEYERHFERRFGARWPALRSALLAPVVHASLVNRYADGPVAQADGAEPLPTTLPSFGRPDSGFPPPQADASGLLAYHLMDAAALLAVEALGVSPADSVLDVCAGGPGSKAVAITQLLDFAGGGQLQCNEVSAERCARLRRVLGNLVPREHSHGIKVTQHDGANHSSFGRLFSRVLVDPPSSADRHLLQNFEDLQRWTPAMPARNAERQFALLCTALQAARSPARVVYTTTALDERECDGVVQAVLRRFPERVRVRPAAQLPFGEPTPLGGWLILPDTAHGWGPVYFIALDVVEPAAAGGAAGEADSQADDDSSEAGSDDDAVE